MTTMLVPSLLVRRRGRSTTFIRRATVAVEDCEATYGVVATRKMLHRLRSMPEGRGLPVRQERPWATSHHARSIAKSNVYR